MKLTQLNVMCSFNTFVPRYILKFIRFQLLLDADKAEEGLRDIPVLEQAIEDGDEFAENSDYASASKALYISQHSTFSVDILMI